MVWAGIYHDGRTQLNIVQGTLNAVKYRDDILDALVQNVLTNTSQVTSCIVVLKDVIKVALLQKGQNDSIKNIVSVFYGIQCAFRTARLAWARTRRRWRLHTWQHILFSDESRFSLRFSDGRYRVYHMRGERFVVLWRCLRIGPTTECLVRSPDSRSLLRTV
jgi:hypothetical protein